MYFGVSIFLMLFTTSQTLMCFECNEANDRDCYNKQVKIECKGYEDSCFTAFVKVPTSENKIESTEQSLWKGCTERKTCNEQCSWYNERGHSCQELCCLGNECNKHGMTTQPRSKRQYNDSYSNRYKWWLLIICSVVSIFLFNIIK